MHHKIHLYFDRNGKKNVRLSFFFLCLISIYLIGFFSHAIYLKKTVYGDGIFYYSWLRSTVIDKNANFENEYHYFDVHQPITPLRIPGNKYAVGPALLWLPNYLFIHSIVMGDGFTLPYQIMVGVTSVLYVCIGLLLLYRILKKFVTDSIAIFILSILSFSTNLFFYGSLDTVNSHGVSFFAVSVFLAILFQKKINWFALGMSLGLIGLMRPQDTIVGILVIPFLTPIFSKKIPALMTGFLLLFFPQIVAWHTVYGFWFTSPYLFGGEGFSILTPHILEVLFNLKTGLFTYTPLLLLGFFSFFLHWKFKPKLKLFLLFIVLTQLFLISTWSTWWQGASYGCRMFIVMLPLLVVPFMEFFSSINKKIYRMNAVIGILIFASSMLNVIMMLYTLIIL